MTNTAALAERIRLLPRYGARGRVSAIIGLLVEASGLDRWTGVGDHCRIVGRNGADIGAEIVGIRGQNALLLPFGSLAGIGAGCTVTVTAGGKTLFPSHGWLGRVVDAFGRAIDGGAPMPTGLSPYPTRNVPPPAHHRGRIGGKLDVGVRALNTFLTCCQGQRLGIFAGSGVGKSTLLSMMARHAASDVNVIGLIGERGREAREFIEDTLGEEGLRRSVVVVATSDEAAAVRRQAAYATMAIAEYFRDQGAAVLCMIDSVTRFAMAQREIGLAIGEPPATKGYTPSVFAELPALLERAGPGREGQGTITGLFTVLVDGDDHNEPIADAVRGILDGHIVLDRAIAERGRYPPVNILRSVSRSMPACNLPEERGLISRARQIMATFEDMAELIRLGAYRHGTDAKVDEAVELHPRLELFLAQAINERTSLAEGYRALAKILGGNEGNGAAPA